MIMRTFIFAYWFGNNVRKKHFDEGEDKRCAYTSPVVIYFHTKFKKHIVYSFIEV